MRSTKITTPSAAMRAALLDPAFARVSKHEDTPEQALRRARLSATPSTPMRAALLRALPR